MPGTDPGPDTAAGLLTGLGRRPADDGSLTEWSVRPDLPLVAGAAA
jgi:hypothetical protein